MPSDTPPPIHPFGPLLEADEPLLWLARPDPDTFRADKAKLNRCILIFCAAILFAIAWPFKVYTPAEYAAGALVLALGGLALVNRIANQDEDWSETWYALTPRRLVMQSRDNTAANLSRFRQVCLTDLRDLRLRKQYVRFGADIGTISCITSTRPPAEPLILSCIENPNAVLALIEEARTKIAAGAQGAFPHSSFP